MTERVVSTKPTLGPSSRVSVEARRLPVPREHGAWFMLGHSLVLGIIVGGAATSAVLLTAAACLLAFVASPVLRRALRAWQRGQSPSLPVSGLVLLLGALAAGTAATRWAGALLVWAAVGLALAAGYAFFVFRRKERGLLGELWAIAGLTSAAPAAWTAATGRLGAEAWLLWTATFLYFGASVPYVKLRVRQMKEKPETLPTKLQLGWEALAYTSISLAFVSALVAAKGAGWLLLAPFALNLLKVTVHTLRGRAARRLAHVGFAEVAYSSVYVVAAVLAFRQVG